MVISMNTTYKYLVLAVLGLFLFPGAVCAKNDYAGPDDPKTIAAAYEALKVLGDERGAIAYNGRTAEILGFESASFVGASVTLRKMLRNLGARQIGAEILISVSGDVLFDFDKWNVRKEAEKELAKLVKAIKELNKNSVTIEGHTDSKGSESYNLKLSQKRAKAVHTWFVTKGGLAEINIKNIGYGESKPAFPNTNPDGSDNPEGRAKNRRVEIRIR